MERTCDTCGKMFAAHRTDTRYCSGRCRTTAYRQRQAADRPARRRAPLPDQIRTASLDLDRIIRRWQRLADDDRFPRSRTKLTYRSDLVRARDALDSILTRWPEQTVTDERDM